MSILRHVMVGLKEARAHVIWSFLSHHNYNDMSVIRYHLLVLDVPYWQVDIEIL